MKSLTPHHQVERIAKQQKPNDSLRRESLITTIIAILMTIIPITIFIICLYYKNHKKTRKKVQEPYHQTFKAETMEQI